jgi:hypothetical protein
MADFRILYDLDFAWSMKKSPHLRVAGTFEKWRRPIFRPPETQVWLRTLLEKRPPAERLKR